MAMVVPSVLLPQIRLPQMRGMQQASPMEVCLVKIHPEYGKVPVANFTWLICAILQVTRFVHCIEWGDSLRPISAFAEDFIHTMPCSLGTETYDWQSRKV